MFSVQIIDPSKAKLAGRLDASQTDTAEKELKKLQGEVTLDLSGLEYISSAGLGVFIGLYKRLSASEGSLVIEGASDHILHIFRLVRLDQLLTFK